MSPTPPIPEVQRVVEARLATCSLCPRRAGEYDPYRRVQPCSASSCSSCAGPNVIHGRCPLGLWPLTVGADYEPTPANAVEGECGC